MATVSAQLSVLPISTGLPCTVAGIPLPNNAAASQVSPHQRKNHARGVGAPASFSTLLVTGFRLQSRRHRRRFCRQVRPWHPQREVDLAGSAADPGPADQRIRVAIHGFGRIGRSILRGWLAQTEKTFDIVAVTLGKKDVRTATHLLKYDSTFGRLEDLSCTDTMAVANGQVLHFVQSPSALGELGVDVIIDATGKNNTIAKGSKLIEEAGATNVVTTCLCNGAPNYVHNINSSKFDVQQDKVVSVYGINLALAIKVIDDTFDIQCGMTTFIQAYTSDMSLVDARHKDLRKARAAALNIIPTTTGTQKAVVSVIPKLQGKFSGIAMRVPTPSVSMQDAVLKVAKPCTREEVNDAFRAAAAGPMRDTLRVEEQPLVSSDFRQSNHSQVVDAALTMVMGGDLVKVVTWCGNEWSYGQHVLRFLSVVTAKLKEVRRPVGGKEA